jgi:hypothetical protein
MPAMVNPRARRSGQALLEYALLYVGVILPLTFGLLFLCEMLWVWHSVVELTRDTARYAATHCYQDGNANVTTYAQTHVPRMIDMQQFIQGPATINVAYFSQDPTSGQLIPFAGGCSTDCSVDCLPDAVTVTVQNYTFVHFLDFLKLPGVPIPQFPTSLPMESAGCDPQLATCISP